MCVPIAHIYMHSADRFDWNLNRNVIELPPAGCHCKCYTRTYTNNLYDIYIYIYNTLAGLWVSSNRTYLYGEKSWIFYGATLNIALFSFFFSLHPSGTINYLLPCDVRPPSQYNNVIVQRTLYYIYIYHTVVLNNMFYALNIFIAHLDT